MFELKEGDRPFVVAIRAVDHERQAFVAVSIGVEFAHCSLDAWNQAAFDTHSLDETMNRAR